VVFKQCLENVGGKIENLCDKLNALSAPNSPYIELSRGEVPSFTVVMAELTGIAKRAAGGEMRMSMAEVFVMRDGKIAERRAWVIPLNENEYR
jgi:ketosteroid isomerase-like protein